MSESRTFFVQYPNEGGDEPTNDWFVEMTDEQAIKVHNYLIDHYPYGTYVGEITKDLIVPFSQFWADNFGFGDDEEDE